jgi:hypothetical protein
MIYHFQFVYVETSFHFGDESYLIMVNDVFNMQLDPVSYYSILDFYISPH